jgi:hypothetical protein
MKNRDCRDQAGSLNHDLGNDADLVTFVSRTTRASQVSFFVEDPTTIDQVARVLRSSPNDGRSSATEEKNVDATR